MSSCPRPTRRPRVAWPYGSAGSSSLSCGSLDAAGPAPYTDLIDSCVGGISLDATFITSLNTNYGTLQFATSRLAWVNGCLSTYEEDAAVEIDPCTQQLVLDPVSVACCDAPVPQTLYATIANDVNCAVCLPEPISVPLTYTAVDTTNDYFLNDRVDCWVGTADICGHTLLMRFYCNPSTGAWVLAYKWTDFCDGQSPTLDTDGALTATDATSCSPFEWVGAVSPGSLPDSCGCSGGVGQYIATITE